MNHLVVTFADGRQFSIPVKVLAADIAKYFAKNHRPHEAIYDAEFNYYRRNPEYLIAWASDLPWAKIRRLLNIRGISESILKGYRAEWGNAYKEIVDL